MLSSYGRKLQILVCYIVCAVIFSERQVNKVNSTYYTLKLTPFLSNVNIQNPFRLSSRESLQHSENRVLFIQEDHVKSNRPGLKESHQKYSPDPLSSPVENKHQAKSAYINILPSVIKQQHYVTRKKQSSVSNKHNSTLAEEFVKSDSEARSKIVAETFPKIIRARDKRSDGSSGVLGPQMCLLVCGHCKVVLGLWSALCFRQCEKGGTAVTACMVVWTEKNHL